MSSTPEDPSEPDENKLELPSLGGMLRRRRKSAKQADPEVDLDAPGAANSSEPVEETRPLRVSEPAEHDEPPTILVPDDNLDESGAVREPEYIDDTADEDTDVTHIDWDDDPTRAPHRVPVADHGPELVAPEAAYAEEEPEEPPRKRRRPSMPSLPSTPDLSLPLLEDRIAVAVTGVVVGLTGVLLTYLFQLGCGAVRGAGSCGTAGLLLLLAVLIVMVFEGAALLRAWFVDEALTTSFLAVALLAVVSMLVLLPIIDRWFMVIVIPVLSAGLFWLSWFVTSRFDAPEREAQRERENAR